jgi:hypothetical protein
MRRGLDSLIRSKSRLEGHAMRRAIRRSAVICGLSLLSIPFAIQPATAQELNAALRDRVAQLLERLASDKAETRNAAEKSFTELGARIMPLVEEAVAKAADADLKARLERIRAKLLEAQEAADLEAKKITIKGDGLRLSEVLRELQSQSGNRITDLRELYGQDATNPALDLAIDGKPFLEALDIVAAQAGLNTSFFTGDGTVGLMAGAMYDQAEPSAPAAAPMRLYSGPFRIELKQYAVQSDFGSGQKSANAQFEIDWEPRLRPMLLSLQASNVEITDDTGKKVEPSVSEEAGTVVLRPENPAAELNLNMTCPDRAATKFATLKVKADVTVPASNQLFRFKSLAEKNVTEKKGQISVKLVDAEIDEFAWKVNLELTYDGEGEAFETYRQGLFNNRIWLQRADGSRFEQNGGFNQTGGSGGTLSFQYLFVDAPGKLADYQLVYETPGKILTIPVEFTFKDVPLP